MDNWDTGRAIREALAAEMTADHSVVLLGEQLETGGLFGATEGLAAQFEGRTFDIPYDEGALVGAAVGMAISGMRPVCELLLADHLSLAYQQIAGELANLRYTTGGEFQAPVVIRAAVGRGTRGGPRQSLSPEAMFANVPGLTIVAPSTPIDAYGLLRAAIRSDDPVLFLESKSLYRSEGAPVDTSNGRIELGKARLVRSGEQISLFSWGATVRLCLAAAEQMAGEGVSVEVLDLRTLVPLDQQAILASAARTGRAVVVHEGSRTGGFGAEVAALIGEGALEYLQAPVLRVGAADAPVPWQQEDHGAVDVRKVLEAIRATVWF